MPDKFIKIDNTCSRCSRSQIGGSRGLCKFCYDEFEHRHDKEIADVFVSLCIQRPFTERDDLWTIAKQIVTFKYNKLEIKNA